MTKADVVESLTRLIELQPTVDQDQRGSTPETKEYEELYWQVYSDLAPIKAGIRSSIRQAGEQPKSQTFEDFLDDFSDPDANSHADILELLSSPAKALVTWKEYKGMGW